MDRTIEKRPVPGTGLIVGKFYPPHLGHSFLIETALAQCETLTIIVIHKIEESILGSRRAFWIRENHPQAKVFIKEDHQYPDDDSKLWAALAVHWLGYVPEAVFTSEDYGDPWSKAIGCRHVLVDKARVNVPISATMVRQDPQRYAEYLPENVRKWFEESRIAGS